ncbi:acyltransferase [Marseilla massiliensis]|uniref:Acyltransferase n=1 Tax=Marseilla massiliensis TaxID=1841864 RepID=A0A938WN71_9BACT|nr:hypothetical protein [Marseilla massiliensis]MBM6662072.1 hypothetical protein [Marseilla massiliensis]
MNKLSILRAIFSSVYFNFKYLPFRQAIKLPILLYKPRFKELNGHIVIEAANVYFGMVRMGFWNTLQYPDSGIVYENKGGTIIFKGKCTIGNASSISVGKKARVEIGDSFECNAALKLISVRNVTFGIKTSLGWDMIVMDTGFHPLKIKATGQKMEASAPIKIGDYNWFGTRSVILKGVDTPHHCIFCFGSMLTKKVECEPYSLLAGTPPVVKKTGIYRDFDDDMEFIE